MTSTWKSTSLWNTLRRRDDAEANEQSRLLLLQYMDKIELVLSKGGTAPLDFTLHDEDHAFRVAERMITILPNPLIPKLSGYEIALLILSAYLHDIGMTPSRGKVTEHYNYLLTGASGTLQEAERLEFLNWLDNHEPRITSPVVHGTPTAEDLSLASIAITHYCRHKHNDWSKEWIEKELDSLDVGSYPDYREDLINLCQSHHREYNELASDRFDPKILPDGSVIHLRYLACVLRIADVLENDPERTPDIIRKHRSIAKTSEIYWWKDHDFFVRIEGKAHRVVARAKPRNAAIHRAILNSVSQIETELRLCRRLAEFKQFKVMPAHDELPHEWLLSDSVLVEIRPLKDSYEYIEGAFRPNTEKLLELLGGIELYKEKLTAVRELLQNALDGVKQRIAYERLNLLEKNPKSEMASPHRFGTDHLVELSICRNPEVEGEWWLVCEDDGIGMNKSIIENYLLVSGASRKPDLIQLERACNDKGFSSQTTGRFGIGVLSYFMIASQVQFETRRSQIAGDSDGTAWLFTTTGVGSFGELRKSKSRRRGTCVKLKLKTGLFGDDAIYDIVEKYLLANLTALPCRFILKSDAEPKKKLELPPGWVRNPAYWLRQLYDKVTWPYLSRFDMDEITTSTHWFVEEGPLPEGFGSYRLGIPYFELEGGLCLGYLRTQMQGDHLSILPFGGRSDIRIRDIEGYLFKHLLTESYNGIIVEGDAYGFQLPESPTAVVEIDWQSERAGKVSVERTTLLRSPAAINMGEYVAQRLRDGFLKVLEKGRGSAFSLLNEILTGSDSTVLNKEWITTEMNSLFRIGGSWKPIRLPAFPANSPYFYFGPLISSKLDLATMMSMVDNKHDKHTADWFSRAVRYDKPAKWRGKELWPVKELSIYSGGRSIHGFPLSKPDCIATVHDALFFNVVPIWEKSTFSQSQSVWYGIPHPCTFPPFWEKLLAVKLEFGPNQVLLNSAHPATALIANKKDRIDYP